MNVQSTVLKTMLLYQDDVLNVRLCQFDNAHCINNRCKAVANAGVESNSLPIAAWQS